MKSLLRRLPYFYFLVLLPCLIYTAFYTARALRLDYVDIPTWDAWRCVADLDQLDQFHLSPLWKQHNEHRVIGVELLYWLDFSLLRGHQFLLIGCEIVCQLAQLALLWWLLKKMEGIPLPFRLAFAAGCGILMTTAIHVQAMVIPFLVQWYLTQALAFVALLLLWRAAQKKSPASLAVAIAATVVTTYTTGNGMLLWPVLIGMAVGLCLPRKQIAALMIAAAITTAVYFTGYKFSAHGSVFLLLRHPVYTVGFMATFLGAPASYISGSFGRAIGLTGMIVTMYALVVTIRRRNAPDMVSSVAVGFCLFIVLSALMVAYGRVNPADPTFLKARAVRYAMISLTFWASLVVLMGWLLTRLSRGRQYAWHLAAAAMTAVLLVAVMGQQEASERAGAARQAKAAEGAIGLETAVQDRQSLAEVYQNPTFVWQLTPVLQHKRLSIFAAGRQDWMGRQIGEPFNAGAAALCSGSMDAVTVVDNGFRVQGRAFDLRTHQPPEDIVLVNDRGTVVGLGATRAGGYPLAGPTRRPPSNVDWVAFARADRWSNSIQAYAVVGHGKTACPLGVPQLVPVRTREHLAPLWLPGYNRSPRCLNAQIKLLPNWIELTPITDDPQLLFDIGPSLAGVRTVIIRARFQKPDGINAFFGKQVDGRGINGSVPSTGEWLDVYLNMSHNRFWESEHGERLRFDPVSSAGPGTAADIAGIWGSTEAAETAWPDMQFYPVPAGEAPER